LTQEICFTAAEAVDLYPLLQLRHINGRQCIPVKRNHLPWCCFFSEHQSFEAFRILLTRTRQNLNAVFHASSRRAFLASV